MRHPRGEGSGRLVKKKKKLEVFGEGFVLIDVDNPYYNPGHEDAPSNTRKSKAVYNYRESPPSLMYARGKLDAAQYRAAEWFRSVYEAGGSSIKAMDWRREPVDGGKMQDPYTQRRSDAHKTLETVYTFLGPQDYVLIEKFCGQGFFLNQITWQETGGNSKRQEKRISDRIKTCLTALAIDRGYQKR
jgi:hypothetical protein